MLRRQFEARAFQGPWDEVPVWKMYKVRSPGALRYGRAKVQRLFVLERVFTENILFSCVASY